MTRNEKKIWLTTMWMILAIIALWATIKPAQAGMTGNCYCLFTQDRVQFPIGPRIDWGVVTHKQCTSMQGGICGRLWTGSPSVRCEMLYTSMFLGDKRLLPEFYHANQKYSVVPICRPMPGKPDNEFVWLDNAIQVEKRIKKGVKNDPNTSRVPYAVCPTNLPPYQAGMHVPWEALGVGVLAVGTVIVIACAPYVAAVATVGGVVVLGTVSGGDDEDIDDYFEPISCHERDEPELP